jgi:hypothetical protein
MKSIRMFVFSALLTAFAVPLGAQPTSPYAGPERNEISSLPPQDVNALLTGQGMGYAKAAELNGYPGPLHVIELADQLALTSEQLSRTRQLMEEHKARARRLGAEVVAAELALDRLFKVRNAKPSAVSAAAQHIGGLQARLRAEHLNTHVAQTALLNTTQIRRYAELRGYASEAGQGDGTSADPSKSTHHNRH